MLRAEKELLTEITHVPSLKSDSPSIITVRRCGIGNRLKIAPTATGSVAAKIAPNKSASNNGTPKIKPKGIPIKNIVTTRPMIAKKTDWYCFLF